jgi:LuxR family quorum sensing-dependent transcriptional regulator
MRCRPKSAATASRRCCLSASRLHLMALYAFDHLRRLQWPPAAPRSVLTEREREVLVWIAQGKSAWEIGEILNISERTVHKHAQTCMRKVGAVNRTQAVAVALRGSLIAL